MSRTTAPSWLWVERTCSESLNIEKLRLCGFELGLSARRECQKPNAKATVSTKNSRTDTTVGETQHCQRDRKGIARTFPTVTVCLSTLGRWSCKRLTNMPVRQAESVLKCPDDRKNRVV